MEELLIILIQGLIEVIGEIFFYSFFDCIDCPLANRHDIKVSTFSKAIFYLLIGVIFGSLSLLIIKHTLIHYQALRMVNLFCAPFLSGLIYWKIAQFRKARKSIIEPKAHFWFAFCFTLGFAIIRFAYADR